MASNQKFLLFTVSCLLFAHPIFAVGLDIANVNIPAIAVTLTVLMFGNFLIMVKHRHCYATPRRYLGALPIIALFGVLISSQSWSIAPLSAAVKAEFLNIIVILPCLIIFLVGGLRLVPRAATGDAVDTRKSFIRVGIGLMIYGALFAVLAVPSASGRLMLPGIDNPIWTARFAGAFYVVLLYRFNAQGAHKPWMLMVLFSLVALYILMLTSSRAVFLALFVAGIYIFQRSMSQLVLRASVAAAIAYAIVAINGLDFVARGYYSIIARQNMLEFGMNLTFSWLGAGIGSFGALFLGFDTYYYPHNIFLELLIETGIVGLALFCLCAYVVISRRDRSEFKSLFLFFLAAAVFSGDIVGNAQLLYLATAILMTKRQTS